jgi:hypothetical protein
MAMLLVVVARHRLDRYEDFRQRFEDSNNVRIVLDRRESERRRLSGHPSAWIAAARSIVAKTSIARLS